MKTVMAVVREVVDRTQGGTQIDLVIAVNHRGSLIVPVMNVERVIIMLVIVLIECVGGVTVEVTQRAHVIMMLCAHDVMARAMWLLNVRV